MYLLYLLINKRKFKLVLNIKECEITGSCCYNATALYCAFLSISEITPNRMIILNF